MITFPRSCEESCSRKMRLVETRFGLAGGGRNSARSGRTVGNPQAIQSSPETDRS